MEGKRKGKDAHLEIEPIISQLKGLQKAQGPEDSAVHNVTQYFRSESTGTVWVWTLGFI
jgi:hypothetical protein